MVGLRLCVCVCMCVCVRACVCVCVFHVPVGGLCCLPQLDLLDPHLTVFVCLRSNHRTTMKANRLAIWATRLREERQEIKRGEVEEGWYRKKRIKSSRVKEREAMCYVHSPCTDTECRHADVVSPERP